MKKVIKSLLALVLGFASLGFTTVSAEETGMTFVPSEGTGISMTEERSFTATYEFEVTKEELEAKMIHSRKISIRSLIQLFVTVEDKEDKMLSIKDKIEDIEELNLVKDNEDGTKQYKVVTEENVDLRKKMFEVLPKEDITIFELKKAEISLEDAFMKIIDDKEEIIEEVNEGKTEDASLNNIKK